MATEDRLPDVAVRLRGRGLGARLFAEPYRFEFFQAVRLLERIYPHLDAVARSGTGKEVVRFRTHVSMAFPASEVYDIASGSSASDSAPATAPTMWVTFFGLAGALGALPSHYTHLLADPAARQQTAAFRDFLDIFDHRLISLFYRAWEKYRFPIAYERRRLAQESAEGAQAAGDRAVEDRSRPDLPIEEDAFSQYLYCLIGMGTSGLQKRGGLSDEILLYYAGLLGRRPRSAAALEGILQDYFGVPVEVEQFSGQWFLMNADALTRLGPDGQNDCLGSTTVLWERIWDPQARFRVRIGPLTYKQFLDFMPSSDAYRDLQELTRFVVGEEFSFEVQPVLRADQVPACALGDESMRAGWNMWLKTEPFDENPSQPVFEARVAYQFMEGAA
jgi:type VI secretion system protein ImpH